jgi:SAM-dependent methyltransferase
MGVLSRTIGNVARKLDREFGLRAVLKGEPRPPKGGFDLAGEKLLDWGWICVNLPDAPKRALEIGCGESPILPAMIAKGYDVTGVDFDPSGSSVNSGFRFVQGDFTSLALPGPFDVVIACSVVEHIGLSGRYGSSEDPEGDLKAMRKIRSLLSPGGVAFITVPVGVDVVHRPWHRVYGKQRLPLLIEGYSIVRSRFMVKEPFGPWCEKDQGAALNYPINLRGYALGELMLAAK